MVRETMRTIEVDGARIAYLEAGDPDAEPLVLLHGYAGNRRSWRHQIPALAGHRRVLAVDWLGWGDSDRPLGLGYDYRSEVDRLGRVLTALGAERVDLCGHDYGGFLALGLCQAQPQRVARLALLNSRAQGTFTPRWYATFGSLGVLGRVPGLRALGARLPLGLVHRRSFASALRAGHVDRDLVESYVGWMSGNSDGGRWLMRFFAGYSVRTRPELGAGLRLVACPTEIVWGEDDPYLSPAIARELAAKIPGAHLAMLPGTGHFVMEERPDEVSAALLDLLARSSTPAGLCDSCAHQRLVPNTRGSTFSLCRRSAADPSYPRYPSIPVTACPGHEPRGRGEAAGAP